MGSAVEGGSTSSYSGEEWRRYFRETYGSDKVVWENATPSQLARSWQGTGKYIGVDDYVDTEYDSELVEDEEDLESIDYDEL